MGVVQIISTEYIKTESEVIISTEYTAIEFRLEFITQINQTALIHMKNGVKTVVLNTCLVFEISIWKVTPLSYSLRIHVSYAQELRNANRKGGFELQGPYSLLFQLVWYSYSKSYRTIRPFAYMTLLC